MRVKLGRGLGFALVAVVALAGTASAQTVDWATCSSSPGVCNSTTQNCCTSDFQAVSGNKPVIIPMDRCHQQYANNDAPGVGPPGSADKNGWCSDPNPYNANGMFYVYGLVYRLMQSGIPVYWIVNPTKTASSVTAYQNPVSNQLESSTDIDFWVLSTGANPPKAPNSVDTLDELTTCGAGCTPPVLRLSSALATVSGSYTKQEFPLRGGAFLIAGSDRANFNKFWNHQSPYPSLSGRACGQSSNDCYNFTDVTLYEVQSGSHYAWQDFLQSLVAGYYVKHDNEVPVAVKLNYQPPRIARVGSTSAVATGWLKSANLDDPASNASCATGTAFSPSDAVYCQMSEAQIQSNNLVSGAFGWAWIDKATFSSCSTSILKLKTFMTAVPGFWTAGNVMFNESSVSQVETCANQQILGASGPAANALSANNTAINEVNTQPLLVRYPTNLFTQWGDIPISFVSGAVTNWTTSSTRSYSSVFTGASNTLKRLVTQEHTRVAGTNLVCGDTNDDGDLGANNSPDANEFPHSKDLYPHNNLGSCDYFPSPGSSSADNIDLATYGRYLNDPNNGIAFYTPGNQINTSPGELRMVLNSLIATPAGTVSQVTTSTTEVARSAPVVATIANQSAVVQGTFEYASPAPAVAQVTVSTDASAFTFPYRKGHLHAVTASTSLNQSYSNLSAATGEIFDAADHLPATTSTYSGGCSTFPKASGTANCRTIFTTTASGANPATVFFDSAHATAIGALIATGTSIDTTAQQTIMQRVIAGSPDGSGGYVAALGGVNRSTTAVIEASPVAGPTRPKMAYFGAEDGMLHAVCAEVNVSSGCDALGRELWAYIPRTLLPFLRTNTARIDGSPHVADVFDDFNADGKREWKTILTLQIGMGDTSSQTKVPAVYALDVTDPKNPSVLWEYSQTVASQGTYELGNGLTVAGGIVTINAVNQNLVFAQTNNGGSGGAASVITAINAGTGTKVWQSAYAYPSPRTSGDDVVVTSGLPGGVVAVDKTGAGLITHLVSADLYGNVWLRDPATGASSYGGSTPLFSFSSDYHAIGGKPAIYATAGSQYAVIVSGGYADASDTTWPMQCVDTVGTRVCKSTGGTSAFPLQYAIAISLNTPSSAVPLDETSGPCPGGANCSYIGFKKQLGQDEKGFSQALIVGSEIFFTTDTEDINRAGYGTGANSGHVYGLTFTGANAANFSGGAVAIAQGASSVVNNGQSLFVGAGQSLSYQAASSGTSGTSVDPTQSNKVTRKLWLRSE